MKAKTFVLFVIGVAAMHFTVQAQECDTCKHNEIVIVVGSYDPRLMDFPKKNFSPGIENTVLPRTEMKYTVFPQPLKIGYQTTPISAPKMAGEPFKELYGNYIRVGFGTGRTPYGELFVNTKRSKTKSVGLYMKHFSTNGKIDEYGYPGFSNNAIQLSGSNIRSKSTLSGKLFFDRNVVHYYGFKPSEIADTLTNDDIRQRYNDAGGQFSWFSTHADSTHLNFKADIDYHCFWNINNAMENSIALKGYLNKKVSWMPKVSKNQTIGVRYQVQHYFNDRGFKSYNAGLFELSPFINSHFGKIFIEVSPKLMAETDSTAQAYIFPYVKLELNLLPGTLSAFGGLDGDLRYNSYRLLTETNPYIHSFVSNEYTKTTQILYGGIRGNIARSLSYTIQAINRKMENCPLFVNSPGDDQQTTMDVVYDQKVSWFRAEFNSELRIKSKWKGFLMVAYNQAESVSEEKAWNIPDMDGMVGLGYNLSDKILVSARVFYVGKRYFKPSSEYITLTGNLSGTLDPFVDANLSIEYRYKMLSAFLQFSNLTAQRYMIWNNYPSYRLRFLGGITYSF